MFDVVRNEDVCDRFGHVAIASGDGDFVDVIEFLRANGVRCTVIADPTRCSRRLRLIADDFIDLPPLDRDNLDDLAA